MVNVMFNLFADSIFLQIIQPTFFNFRTWFLQGLCFYVMPFSFQLVPNFLVKMHFLEIGIFFIFIFFINFCVYSITPKTIQGIWMDLYRDVDPDDQALCTQGA